MEYICRHTCFSFSTVNVSIKFILPLKAVEKEPLPPGWCTTGNLSGISGWILKFLPLTHMPQRGGLLKCLLSAFKTTLDHTQFIYWSDLWLDVGSRPLESDPATWQKPNKWPLCEKADWFSPLCFLHFIHHLLLEMQTGCSGAGAHHSSVNRLALRVRVWNIALQLAGLRVESGKWPFGSFDKKTLTGFLSHHQR